MVNATDGTLSAEFEYGPFGENIKAVGTAANAQPFGFSTKYTDPETSLCYYGLRYYNPSTGRWPNRDPLGENAFFEFYAKGRSPKQRAALTLESRRPPYVFLNNECLYQTDYLGLAYFAYRPLGGVLGVTGVVDSKLDDKLNTVMGHEQLFFEDGKSPANIGFFNDGTTKTEPNTSNYRGSHSSGWNDCVMRKAISNVPLRPYCLLGKPGPTEKFNCQDWAEAVRVEYRRLIKDTAVVASCCPTDAEKKK